MYMYYTFELYKNVSKQSAKSNLPARESWDEKTKHCVGGTV